VTTQTSLDQHNKTQSIFLAPTYSRAAYDSGKQNGYLDDLDTDSRKLVDISYSNLDSSLSAYRFAETSLQQKRQALELCKVVSGTRCGPQQAEYEQLSHTSDTFLAASFRTSLNILNDTLIVDKNGKLYSAE
jgi:hypothetical protein